MKKAYRYGIFYFGAAAMVVGIFVMGSIAIYALAHPGKFPSTAAIVLPTSFAVISLIWALRTMFRKSPTPEQARQRFLVQFWLALAVVAVATFLLYNRAV